MSNRKHSYDDEKFSLLDLPWDKMGTGILICVAIIIIFFLGRFAYTNFFNKPKTTETQYGAQEEKKQLPNEIKGYKVIGKIKINNFSQYIIDSEKISNDTKNSIENTSVNEAGNNVLNIDDSNIIDNSGNNAENTENVSKKDYTDALKNGVVKLYGDKLDEVGNFCIMGHNTEGMFFILNDLSVNDKFSIETNYKELEYIITEIKTIEPTELECLMPNKEYKEVTLITCAEGSNKRLIIKALQKEDYEKLNNVSSVNNIENTTENVTENTTENTNQDVSQNTNVE